jgi:hypothetical protein
MKVRFGREALKINRLKSFCVLVAVLAIGGLLAAENPVCAQTAAGTIEAVAVSVKTNAASTPPRVARNLSISIEAVGQQILLGRSVSEVAQNRESYERLVKEIFDRVLSGYSVARVTVTASRTAHIDVVLAPWNDVVTNAVVELDFGGLPPPIAELIENDAKGAENQITDILIGLPVEAIEWAGVMVKSVLREYLAEKLPEFRPNFDIGGGRETVVRISLIPSGAIIKNVDVITASKTIPNVVAAGFKPLLKELSESMIGLPVAFVERHKEYFAQTAKKTIDENSYTKKYALLTEASIATGVVSQIEIGVETMQYVINIEGHLDIGRSENKDNTTATVHLGRKFGSKYKNEVFMEMKVVPGTVSFDFESGLGRKFTRVSTAEFRYNLSDDKTKLRLIQQVHPKYSIRIERNLPANKNAFTLRYSVPEMLSAEYLITNQEKWFRLIFHM